MRARTFPFAYLLAAMILVLMAPGSASADTVYTANLAGSNEVPPNASPATGSITVLLHLDTLQVNEIFSGLLAPASAAHIHCCGPGGTNQPVAVPFVGFPSVTSGTYSHLFDLIDPTTYTSAFITAHGGTASSAEAALISGLDSFQTYANIHDALFPGGEIRGQLAQTPEPSSLLLFGSGLAALAQRRWSRRKISNQRSAIS